MRAAAHAFVFGGHEGSCLETSGWLQTPRVSRLVAVIVIVRMMMMMPMLRLRLRLLLLLGRKITISTPGSIIIELSILNN